MAGRIMRIFRNVEQLRDGSTNPDFVAGAGFFWTEYLCEDGPHCRFSREKSEAILFPSHGAADTHAAELRAGRPELGFLFGVSCSTPAPVGLPPSSVKRRRSRRERLEEEMRAADLAELEREEIYG
ncbi:hypothetical protein BH20VER3_BH20VER3_00740 [soil metagenome]